MLAGRIVVLRARAAFVSTFRADAHAHWEEVGCTLAVSAPAAAVSPSHGPEYRLRSACRAAVIRRCMQFVCWFVAARFRICSHGEGSLRFRIVENVAAALHALALVVVHGRSTVAQNLWYIPGHEERSSGDSMSLKAPVALRHRSIDHLREVCGAWGEQPWHGSVLRVRRSHWPRDMSDTPVGTPGTKARTATTSPSCWWR